jgi:hypothetical protein
VATRHGARTVVSDVHYQESVKEHLSESGLSFESAPGGNSGKSEVYTEARELIHSDRVRWSRRHKELTRQMREVMSRPLAGGLIQISSPRRKGAHGDLASALTLALWAASHPSFVKKFLDMGTAIAARGGRIFTTDAERRRETQWHDARPKKL